MAVVKAALQFWNDEMSPHNKDVWRWYFESPDDAPDLPVASEAQELFLNCELKLLQRRGDDWQEVAAHERPKATDTVAILFEI